MKYRKKPVVKSDGQASENPDVACRWSAKWKALAKRLRRGPGWAEHFVEKSELISARRVVKAVRAFIKDGDMISELALDEAIRDYDNR